MQKILLDENLSPRLSVMLSSLFKSVHVLKSGLGNSYDGDIWKFAKENQYAIITKDNDFKELSNYWGCPPKVIRINCGNKNTLFIHILIAKFHAEINEFISSAELCYMEIS